MPDRPPIFPLWRAAFTLDREPMPKPRPRARVIPGAKPFAHIYTPSEAAREEAALDALAAQHAPRSPWLGPVALHVTAALPIPKAFARWEREAALAGKRMPRARGSGDGDNYAKLLQDALSLSGRWWKDDAQVVRLVAEKVYAERPGWLVEVYFLPEIASAEEWKSVTGGTKGLFAEGAGT